MKTKENMSTEKKFAQEVAQLAKQYGVNVFMITEGYSVYINSGNNPAVRNARSTFCEWEARGPVTPTIEIT